MLYSCFEVLPAVSFNKPINSFYVAVPLNMNNFRMDVVISAQAPETNLSNNVAGFKVRLPSNLMAGPPEPSVPATRSPVRPRGEAASPWATVRKVPRT